jgi:hypothetical protein
MPHPVPHVLVILLTQQEVRVKKGEENRVQAVYLDKVRKGVQTVHLHKVRVKGAQEKGVQAVHLHKVEVKGAQEEVVQVVKGTDKVRVKALQLHKVGVKIAQEEGVKAVQLLHKVGGQKSNLGLATRKRISSRLRTFVFQTRMHKSKGKLLVDLTGNPVGPLKAPGGGLACLWGPPRSATGITFRVASPDFDMHNLVAAFTTIPQPEVQGVAKKNDKREKKMWRV